MAKHKRSQRTDRVARWAQPIARPPDARQLGLQAFQSGNFDSAIAHWTPPARSEPAVAAALAEAYFRRALLRQGTKERLGDLQQATALAPGEPRYRYHLGLSRHRAGQVPAALECYRAVLAMDSTFSGAALLLALATLEEDPWVDLAALPGSTPEVRSALAPVQALVRGDAGPDAGTTPIERLWHGLGLLRQGDGAARAVLDDHRPLDAARATVVRRYYRGVAAAQAGDLDAAIRDWQHVLDGAGAQPWLSDNLAAALLLKGGENLTPEALKGSSPLAKHLLQLATTNAGLAELAVGALDRAAHAAVAEGDWQRARDLWEQARLVAGAGNLGSPRPLWRNLALASEALERWLDAAEAWRALLRTRPRRARQTGEAAAPVAEAGLSDAQWAWVRRRVIECYKRAGEPGEAVALFRQAIKTDPQDLEARLQLVEALIANEQEQAALNETRRILEIDPDHVEAATRLALMQSKRGYWDEALEVLRGLLARQPESEEVRRQLSQLLLAYGSQQHHYGSFQHALAAYEEGRRIAPSDWHFPVYQARVAIDQRRQAEARKLLEQASELAGNQPDAYTFIIEGWGALGDLATARAVLAQAEARGLLTASLLVSIGGVLLARHKPPIPQRTRARTAPARSVWADLAVELFDRAVALKPNDPQVRLVLVGKLLLSHSELALRYAEEAVGLAPDDPEALIQLGTAQALNDQGQEARQTMRRAARLARQQGKPDAARRADQLQSSLDPQLLRMSLEMAELFGGLDIDLDDLFI